MAVTERLVKRLRLPLDGGWLLRIGAGIVVLFVLLTLLAPWLAPYDPVSYQAGGRLAGPSAAHWLGTDALGRDIFSRLLYGGRIPLEVAVVSAAFAIAAGSVAGWISGYTGGWFDRAFSLVMDSIYSFPSLILAIMIAAVLGPGLTNMVIAVSLIYVPTYFRVARSETLKVREEEYV
ncbi:MAG TPA: ABC transporter permease, partial [Limnochordia bacterium]|nr:ABC transporter permease [Limnochordia bacterium]